MSNHNDDNNRYKFDKPKNDFGDDYGKFKNEGRMYQERGGCLSFFIGFVILAHVGLLLWALGHLVTGETTLALFGYRDYVLAQFGFSAFGLIAAIGLWQWKKWGYYGLLSIYVIGILWNAGSAEFTAVGGNILGLTILHYLMREKTQFLD